MAELPLDPLHSFLLLYSMEKDFNCCHVLLNIISILSIENIFYFPKDQKNNLIKIISKFQIGNSDHILKANILHKYIQAKNKKSFCKENFINKKSMKKAIQIRDQIEGYLKQILKKRAKIDSLVDFTSKDIDSSNTEKILKCLYNGYYLKSAKINNDRRTYNILRTNETAYLHPESICFYSKNKPECIIYNEVVITKRTYLRDVTEIPNNLFKEFNKI